MTVLYIRLSTKNNIKRNYKEKNN